MAKARSIVRAWFLLILPSFLVITAELGRELPLIKVHLSRPTLVLIRAWLLA